MSSSSSSSSVTVLMVAEKPSIAQSVADILSDHRMSTHKGIATPVHTYTGRWHGAAATFKVTSVTGHVFATDFTAAHQSWDSDPLELFSAPTRKSEQKSAVPRHLDAESRGCAALVLWLDCDREGENICFEVVECCARALRGSMDRVYRARFSSITAVDLRAAFTSLVRPNRNEAAAVDARQELDLKVGVAFTRFQTRFFQGKYGNLDATLISYGPCQTPTLGFCVARHDAITKHVAEAFWQLVVDVRNDAASRLRLEWDRTRVFDVQVASALESLVRDARTARVVSSEVSEEKKKKPTPLNTVELLKIASAQLNIGPHAAMQIAERLYISGFISYPRTESSAYAPAFDLRAAVAEQQRQSMWGAYTRSLLDVGLQTPRKGVDAGDHPPITPMRAAEEGVELSGDSWRLYEYVVRHFLASVSPDEVSRVVRARFAIGTERFRTSGRQVVQPGFTLVMPHAASTDTPLDIDAVRKDAVWHVDDVALREGKTAPPGYLTESELIALMERHNIGTDASIPTHIENICTRRYVALAAGRTLVPTKLGIALCHGYHRIDPDLVLPRVRGSIERYIDHIAHGRATLDEVVEHSLEVFRSKFRYFVANMSLMDEYFEATFSSVAETQGKRLSKCGLCRRYMTLIPLRPQRLYCATCEQTYSLPQGGKIKLYQELTCPLDGFELVLFTYGTGGKTSVVCPMCYNTPQLDGQKKTQGCAHCPHPTCRHGVVANSICACETCDFGVLVLDATSFPKWRADCNVCNAAVFLPEAAHRCAVARDVCGECGAKLLAIDFNKKSTPLADGKTAYTACIVCDELLNSLVVGGHTVNRPGGARRGRGGRGRGRGRGGRGSKRGGGR